LVAFVESFGSFFGCLSRWIGGVLEDSRTHLWVQDPDIEGYIKHASTAVELGQFFFRISFGKCLVRVWDDLDSIFSVVWWGKSGDFVKDIIEKLSFQTMSSQRPPRRSRDGSKKWGLWGVLGAHRLKT
jgi:hypothetical protein